MMIALIILGVLLIIAGLVGMIRGTMGWMNGWYFGFGLAGLAAGIVLTILSVGMVVGENTCESQAEGMQVEYDYDFWTTGCRVRLDDGRWIDIDSYRVEIND